MPEKISPSLFSIDASFIITIYTYLTNINIIFANMKTIQATVVKHTGSHYLLSELPLWNPFEAVMRGKVRLSKSKATNPVAVGDRVMCVLGDDDAGREEGTVGCITEVLPRDNYVIRKSTNLSRESHIIASNIDRCFIVTTLAFPEVKLQFLDRLLVTCALYGIEAVILLNKTDLLRELEMADSKEVLKGETADTGPQDTTAAGLRERFGQIYRGAGYKVLEISARTGEGIGQLRSMMSGGPHGGINLLSGMSGVGKSSIIKALDPTLNPRTAEISLAHLQGRHTTTFYEMYPLSSGGFIIDTPGIRSFGLMDIKPEDIALYFPEMLLLSASCRFTPCTHTHEPHCAVKEALQSGRMSPERYASYLGMLEESGKYR